MGKSASHARKAIPPLRDGDRMSAKDFLRRHEAMPEGFHAAFVAKLQAAAKRKKK